MRKIFTISSLLFSNLLFAQPNPGNVGVGNLTAWFRADDLTPGYSVTSWGTTYPTLATTGFSLTPINIAGPYPYANSTPPKNFSNYNNTVDFTGSSDVNNLGLTYIPSGTLNLLDNATTTAQGTMFAVYYIPDTSLTIAATGQHILEYREASSGGDGIQFRRLATLNRCAIGSSNSVNATRDYTETFKPSIFSYKGNYYNSMGAYLNNYTIPSGVSSSSSGGKGLTVGTRMTTSSVFQGSYPGYISEIIFYNTNLTTAQYAQVNSYLAIKYGITLDNSISALNGNGNYLNSNGTTIWDATTNTGIYHHDVIGIGRDDNEGLYQKQSHSFDDSTRIYIGTLSTTNVLNFGSISNDTSYAIIGHNIAPTCASNSTEFPTGYGIYSRIDREWKIVKSNFVDNVSVDITLNNCANIGNISLGDLRLLVDYDDGDFTNATVMNSTTGVGFALNGNTLTITGISSAVIPTTGYITIASVNSATPLPVQNIDLAVKETTQHTAQLNFSVNTSETMLAYDAERSTDGQHWTKVDHIIANNKNTINNVQNYVAYDLQPVSGKSYYRIKATDVKNYNYYSTIHEFNINNVAASHFVYPNPANDFIHIALNNAELKSLKVYNSVMQDVSASVLVNQSNNITTIDIKALPTGMYFIKTNNCSTSFVKQ